MIKKNDFIEVEYTGILKEDNQVFDTTDEKTAKDSNIYNENEVGSKYKPAIICVGQNQILKAVDDSFESHLPGDSYELDIMPENAFGKKEPKLIQFMPTSSFAEYDIAPVPGLQINVDGAFGIVKTVSGGRSLIDFNHPFAGKEIIYKLSIKRIVEDKKEKLKSLFSGMFYFEPEIEINGDEAVITVPENEHIHENKFQEKTKELIPDITTIKFNQKKP